MDFLYPKDSCANGEYSIIRVGHFVKEEVCRLEGRIEILKDFRATYLKNNSEHYPGLIKVLEDKITFTTNKNYIIQEHFEIVRSEITGIEKNNSFLLIPNIIKITTIKMQSFRFSIVEQDRFQEFIANNTDILS